MSLRELSIIVPLAPAERAHAALAADLRALPSGAEVIAAGPERPDWPEARWVSCEAGRARQLNAGARAARKRFLWFLHADSRLSAQAVAALESALARDPRALWYFNLGFLPDGPRLMRVNELGVWVRSHGLGIPFGDQGFCLERATFEKLGGYPEDAPYGEDHLLLWRARHCGVRARCTGARVLTSARKYRAGGWARVTALHGWLTLRQAWPEFLRLLR